MEEAISSRIVPETSVVFETDGSPTEAGQVDGSWELLVGLDSDEEVEELRRYATEAARRRRIATDVGDTSNSGSAT